MKRIEVPGLCRCKEAFALLKADCSLLVSPFSSLLAECRRAALLCVSVVTLLAPASAAQAQRLLTLVPGVGQAASTGDLGPSIGPVPTAVQVDLALLRRAPARLEVPTPEGGVLSAERSVFEDRGGGDLMWSGGQPGAGYDTVVLTVEGGRLVGRFGAAGGGAYQIHAERDGRGGMAPLGGPGLEEWCGVEAGPEDGHDPFAHVRAGALAADAPRRVSNPQSHDRLDILVAYTATAAENWADRGGPHAAIRHAVDYMKMVFRNNRIEVEPHLVHIAQASAALDRVGRDLGWHLTRYDRPLWEWFEREGDLLDLRREHRPDLVHLFTGERALMLGACGSAGLGPGSPATWSISWGPSGWTTNHPYACSDYAVTFVHEVGHNLGAAHDPRNTSATPESVFRPYAFGHTDADVMPSLGTAMSYEGQVEPFFSTPRLRPHGAILGIADERDNERLLQETVPFVAQAGDYLRLDPAPPSDVRVRLEGGAAHLTWRDNAPDADGYAVRWSESRGSTRFFGQKVEGRTGAVVALKSTEPGTVYRFGVSAKKGDVWSLRSNAVVLVAPGESIGAPSEVSATMVGAGTVDIRWADNSDNESGFDVQLLQDGDPIHRERVAADTESSFFHYWTVNPHGGAEYGVRVFAFNSSGYSESSEVATFRWQGPGGAGPVTGISARAIGPTTVRLAWTADPGAPPYDYDVTVWLDRGWRDGRRWGGSRDGVTAWQEFEGLARGGRYTFRIWPVNGVPARAYLTLGERGTGPRAPSDLDWLLEGNRVRLSWKDNSSDERGFEVQVEAGQSFSGELKWRRLLTVPADTESAVVDMPYSDGGRRFRVFAYNDRGYSRASAPSGSCRVDAETLCLQDSRFEVKMSWWKADGESGVGRVVEEGTDDSGLFQFFGPENWEILIKVLDGCSNNGHIWVLGASTTDLGYRIVVTDTITDESRTYTNEPGRPAAAIVDTKAFSQPCRGGAAP